MIKLGNSNNGASAIKSSSLNEDFQAKEKLAQLIWTSVIVGFFAIQAVMWTMAIIFTSTDKSHVIISDYENSSLNWDDEQAIKRASQALGWKASLEVATESNPMGERQLTLKLLDRNGKPIELTQIELNVFHWAEGSIVYPVTLTPSSPGVFSGTLPMRKSGYWNFSAEIQTGGDHYLFEEKQFLNLRK